MYRIRITLLVIVIVLFSSMLFAGNQQKVGLYFNGALGLPMNPNEFSDYWKTSFLNFGAGLGYAFSPILSSNVYFDLGIFAFDGDKIAHEAGLGGVISIDGGSASIMTIFANIKAAVSTGTVRPYFFGGGGLFLLSVDDATVSGGGMVIPLEGASETAVGINFGAGTYFVVAKQLDLFLDGRYVLGFTEGESTGTLPIRLGVRVKL